MNSDNKKVFISYVRENSNEVDKICTIFTENNIDYWIDRKNIEGGKFWKIAISEAISSGAYFLACFSKEYEEKIETHMNEEILLAIDILRKKQFNSGWFIPIKLTSCTIPSHNIGAGNTLQDIQHLDFYTNWDTSIKRLIDMIKKEEDAGNNLPEIFSEKVYLYRGLKSLIESRSGSGFHNADLGHPVYVSGATGRLDDMWEYADTPVRNKLFKMLSELTRELKKMGIEEYRFIWWYDFSEWKDFCQFAVDVYEKKSP